MRPCVLIIDDDPSVARALARLLQRRYEVVTAAGALAGLKALAELPSVDAVIADMCMPDMDGVTLLARAAELRPDAARVLLTGIADLPQGADLVRSGRISRYLAKPCGAGELFDALESCVEGKGRGRARMSAAPASVR